MLGKFREDNKTGELPEINDNALQVNMLNWNQFTPGDFASYRPPGSENQERPNFREYDMVVEHGKDEDISVDILTLNVHLILER